nr:glycosyltransferase family 2 protein [Curtobacterium pusillum]
MIMTVFNRRELTLNCLRMLHGQEGLERIFDLHVWVLDDGSTDGTAEAIRREFPRAVTVLRGSGDQYWSSGMATAQRAAVETDPDFLLWLNDDVELVSNAIRSLLATYSLCEGVVIGAVSSKASGATTYSGFRRVGRRPGQLSQVDPLEAPQRVDTINGNIVLIPRRVYYALGTVEPRFAHAYGDWDYGYRAKRSGIELYLAPGYLGFCERNSVSGTWLDSDVPRIDRARRLFGRKGFPVRSHALFLARHGGWLWPVYFAATYAKAAWRIALGR